MTLNDWPEAKEMARDVLKRSRQPYTQEQLAEIPRITNAKNYYFWCIDNQEWDMLEDAFVPEGYSAYWNGAPGLTDRIKQTKQSSVTCSEAMVPMHKGCNMIVVFDDINHATVLTRLNDYHTYKDDNSTYEGFGYYVDDLERGEDNIWRIKTIRLTYRVLLGQLRR